MSSTDDTTTDPTVAVPDAVRRDERIEPQIRGLEPGECVRVVATTSDDAGDWRSTATLSADDDGVVDLATTAPDAGEYETADAMGLVWTLAPVDDSARAFEWEPDGRHDLTLAVHAVDGEQESPASANAKSADAVVDRDPLATESVTVDHADPSVTRHTPAEYHPDDGHPDAWFEPAGDGPHPAVVVLHGSGGRSVEATAALFASHGYAAFACRWLRADGFPEHPMEVPIDRVEDAIAWFRDHDAVADGGYGLWGVSMGSQLALQLAVRDDAVDAVVADSPVHLRLFGSGTGAWAVDGDVQPYVDRREEPPDRFVYDDDDSTVGRELPTQMYEAASREERQAATIPVEDASADVLLLTGSDDHHWPATAFSNMLLVRLDAKDYDHRYAHDVHHRAGHSIGVPYHPTSFRPAPDDVQIGFGGTPRHAARAAADAWPRTLDWLETSLR